MCNYVTRALLKASFICFCSVCVCVHEHMHVCRVSMHLCVRSHTWLHVHMSLEAQMMLGIFFDCSPPYFLRQILLLSQQLISSSRLPCQCALGIQSPLPLPSTCVKMCAAKPSIYEVFQIQPQVLMLMQQACYRLSNLHKPSESFKYID